MKQIRIKFSYYIIGCVGVGKSTTISHIRSLCTYDEWVDERPQEISKAPELLTAKERRHADDWIAKQFYKKNWRLMAPKEGIHVVDRTPLDPLTFTEPDQRRSKAKKILKNLDPKNVGNVIVPGHVIFLLGNIEEIKSRLLKKHKDWDQLHIKKRQIAIQDIFDLDEMSIIDTHGRSIESVVQEVCKIIHLAEYREVNLHEKLVGVERG